MLLHFELSKFFRRH